MLGHNSASYGETMPAVAMSMAEDKPSPKANRFPYFKFYPRDWLDATRNMSLEERGAYIDLICILMEMEGHLADDDKWISHQMHVSTRKWKSMKTRLVEHEKIHISDGIITNKRCLRELDILLEQRRNISGSALTRERTKRESTLNRERTNVEKTEKSNKNNEPNTTIVPLHARAITRSSDSDIEKEEDKKEDSDPSGSGADAPPAEESLRELVWTKCISWLLPRSCLDEVRLRMRVGRWVQEFGAGAVIDAVAIAQKEAPVSIMAYVEGVLRRKARPKPKSNRMSMAEFIAELDQLEGVRE